ncbi:hypothetical protein F5Y12DRAFT_721640 [Xylaria sp. FL1777]|nr:hypothetical protein F5Y12DRAFT_721640 [Xylaria sp. FL1777]
MSFVDLYEVLNLSSKADVPTIERAFKELSLTMHPDRANVSTIPSHRVETKKEREAREKRNHERFVKIIEARETLTDSKKREQYDLERAKNLSSNKAGKPSQPKYPSKTPRPDESRSKDSRSQKSDTSTGGGGRLDIELAHNFHANSLEDFLIEFEGMLSIVQGTMRVSPSKRGYSDYSAVVSSLNHVITVTKEIANRIREARDLHLRNLNSTMASEAYRSAISNASSYRVEIQALVHRLREQLRTGYL